MRTLVGIECGEGGRGVTYHRGLLTGRVGHRDERKIEIIQVDLTLRLEFVEEIE